MKSGGFLTVLALPLAICSLASSAIAASSGTPAPGSTEPTVASLALGSIGPSEKDLAIAPSEKDLVAIWQPSPQPPEEQLVDTSKVVFGSEFQAGSREGVYGSISATYALNGILGASGFRLQVIGTGESWSATDHGWSSGRRWDDDRRSRRHHGRFDSDSQTTEKQGAALLGYAFVKNDLTIQGFIGPTVVNGAAGHKTQTAMQAIVEAEDKPTKDTLLDAYGTITTIPHLYDVDLRAGYAVLKNVYIGPQAEFIGFTDKSSAIRGGAHITSQFGAIEFTVLGGMEHEIGVGNGAYSGFDVSYRF